MKANTILLLKRVADLYGIYHMFCSQFIYFASLLKWKAKSETLVESLLNVKGLSASRVKVSRMPCDLKHVRSTVLDNNLKNKRIIL